MICQTELIEVRASILLSFVDLYSLIARVAGQGGSIGWPGVSRRPSKRVIATVAG